MSPSPKLETRTLEPTDAAWLEVIHAECFDDLRRWSAALLSSFLANPFSTGVALIENNEPVGFLLGQSASEDAEMVTLAVRPAYQRKGYALKLGETFEQHMKLGGKTRLLLEVAQNNLAAIGLYERLGFTKSGVRPNYYRHGADSVDAVIMQKRL